MRGEQRSRDGGRGHGINGIECPSKGAVQLKRQQQQQRGHVDLGAGIRETQDGILGLVISENTFPFPSFNVCELLNTNILNIKEIRFLSYIYIYIKFRYRPTDTTEWRTMKILSRKITEATINNLNPGREYEFMVLSQDKHGDGMFSKTLRIFTQPSTYRISTRYRIMCAAKIIYEIYFRFVRGEFGVGIS